MSATKGGASGGKPLKAQRKVNRMLLYIFLGFFLVLGGLAVANGLGVV